MPRRASGPRVIGVYRRGRRWRVVYVCEDGTKEEETFEKEGRARRYAEWLARKLSGPGTIEEAMVEYESYLEGKENKARSIDKTISRVKYLLGKTDLPTLTIAELETLYEDRVKEVAADSHQRELVETKTFLRWCDSKGWVPALKIQDLVRVRPTGRKRKGPESKPQLRVDEARRWLNRALELAHEGVDAALGAALTLLCSLRAGEVRGLAPRDVDDGGRLLWVDGTKTESSRRTIEVPEVIRPLLIARAKASTNGSLWTNQGINWVNNWTKRICCQAGVPIVCAHSMRGLHATLAREMGTTGHGVAAQLGHASAAMHEQAYADRAAVRRGSQRRALQVLQGGGEG